MPEYFDLAAQDLPAAGAVEWLQTLNQRLRKEGLGIADLPDPEDSGEFSTVLVELGFSNALERMVIRKHVKEYFRGLKPKRQSSRRWTDEEFQAEQIVDDPDDWESLWGDGGSTKVGARSDIQDMPEGGRGSIMTSDAGSNMATPRLNSRRSSMDSKPILKLEGLNSARSSLNGRDSTFCQDDLPLNLGNTGVGSLSRGGAGPLPARSHLAGAPPPQLRLPLPPPQQQQQQQQQPLSPPSSQPPSPQPPTSRGSSPATTPRRTLTLPLSPTRPNRLGCAPPPRCSAAGGYSAFGAGMGVGAGSCLSPRSPTGFIPGMARAAAPPVVQSQVVVVERAWTPRMQSVQMTPRESNIVVVPSGQCTPCSGCGVPVTSTRSMSLPRMVSVQSQPTAIIAPNTVQVVVTSPRRKSSQAAPTHPEVEGHPMSVQRSTSFHMAGSPSQSQSPVPNSTTSPKSSASMISTTPLEPKTPRSTLTSL